MQWEQHTYHVNAPVHMQPTKQRATTDARKSATRSPRERERAGNLTVSEHREGGDRASIYTAPPAGTRSAYSKCYSLRAGLNHPATLSCQYGGKI